MPTEREVAAKLQALIDRLAEAGTDVHDRLARSVPPRVVQVDVADLAVSFWSELQDGRLDGLHRGPSPDAEIVLTADSETLVEVLDGRRSLLSAYLAGRVRVDAGMSDLIALRKLL